MEVPIETFMIAKPHFGYQGLVFQLLCFEIFLTHILLCYLLLLLHLQSSKNSSKILLLLHRGIVSLITRFRFYYTKLKLSSVL